MVLIKLEHDDIEIFKKIITENDVCPDLIICYFTATWCGPCKKISPDVTNIGNNNDHLIVIKIAADSSEQWRKYFGTEGTSNGKAIHQLSDGGYIVAGFLSNSDGAYHQYYLMAGLSSF